MQAAAEEKYVGLLRDLLHDWNDKADICAEVPFPRPHHSIPSNTSQQNAHIVIAGSV